MTRARNLVSGVAILLLSACGSSPALPDRYYSLVLAGNDSTSEDNDDAATARLIVGPIQLPSYLSESGLPMQVGPNRIESAHHHFWAEPLDEAIAKVLAGEIARQTNGIDVEHESGRFTPQGNCRLRVEFDAFHPMSESRAVASGRYWISSDDTSNRQAFSLTHALTLDGYAHAVDVLRGMLGALAQQISNDVLRTPACTGAASAVAVP